VTNPSQLARLTRSGCSQSAARATAPFSRLSLGFGEKRRGSEHRCCRSQRGAGLFDESQLRPCVRLKPHDDRLERRWVEALDGQVVSLSALPFGALPSALRARRPARSRSGAMRWPAATSSWRETGCGSATQLGIEGQDCGERRKTVSRVQSIWVSRGAGHQADPLSTGRPMFCEGSRSRILRPSPIGRGACAPIRASHVGARIGVVDLGASTLRDRAQSRAGR
jgi:hypothetical protein